MPEDESSQTEAAKKVERVQEKREKAVAKKERSEKKDEGFLARLISTSVIGSMLIAIVLMLYHTVQGMIALVSAPDDSGFVEDGQD